VSILAIDCDFKKHYAVDDTGRIVLKASPTWHGVFTDSADTILFEIASPVDYTPDGNKAIAYNKRKWTIWNIAQAVTLNETCQEFDIEFLVAPSSKWTKGYDLKTRHLMAGCKQKQKDLRECEAMIWFYGKDPSVWVPLPTFLANL
jgi:hypothetical protein